MGARLIPELPKKKHLEEAIKNGSPAICMLSTMLLTKRTFEDFIKRGSRTFSSSHFNTVIGIGGDMIFVNDTESYREKPLEDSEPMGYELGGPQSHNIDDFISAMYLNLSNDADNGCVIIPKLRP